MSRLEQLPTAVRHRILGYLLLADKVRQPPNHLLVENYVFEVNVLRTSRAIHKEGTAILYQENKFIKVYNDFADSEKSMDNHEIPFFKLKGAFKHHVTEIAIKLDPFNKRLPSSMRLKKPTPFLLLLSDIPKYTRLLRLLDLANFIGYQFDFKLHGPPSSTTPLSVMDQEKLLHPFEQVRGVALVQNVSFSGAFGSAVVKRVKAAMTQKIAWLRAGVWEIHDIALSIKRMGDWAFGLGNADMAFAKYEDTETFLNAAMTLNSMMTGLDKHAEKALLRISCTIWVDMALLAISDAVLAEEGVRMYDAVPKFQGRIEAAEKNNSKHDRAFPTSVIARFYYLLGVAELGLGHPVKAAKAFAKAYKLVSDKPTKQGYELAKGWKELGKDTKTASLNTLFASMPNKPLEIPDVKEYITPEVASEHWVTHELGYPPGPIPYDDKIKGALAIILTNKPHPKHHNQGPRTARVGEVKPEVLRKHVVKYRKAMNLPAGKGRLMCWVGLNSNEIGEETMLDQPGHVEMMRNMNLGHTCAPQ